jgi:peptidoglycan/xylan/chitin deacetylase (PgdA/CDA1 family)
LFYHRVSDDLDLAFGGLPVAIFETQMSVLSKYFNVLPLEELVQRAKKNNLPNNAVAITFDDGYRDNYENAFPILKRLGLPATIFLTTGPLEAAAPLWHDLVFDAFKRTRETSMSIEKTTYSLRTAGEKDAALKALRRYLRKLTPKERDNYIRQVRGDLGIFDQSCVGNEKLRWCEIREMSNERIGFGAHTVSHPILTRLSTEEARYEITVSKDTIEKQLGVEVRAFAYPNGTRDDFNESLKRALREAGFLCAVTIVGGTNERDTDPFELRRVAAWDSDATIFALKLGWYKLAS